MAWVWVGAMAKIGKTGTGSWPTVGVGSVTGDGVGGVKGRQTDSRKLENDSGLIRP